ncbi:carboxymuconolactone decarboxylase family protein [Streptomyces sp. MI02-7b]|uniref:carboxymuconolactone decarboxylase family protein n=1 Tax=Streptomyces sp. MI02-7b TaxID=462941 RepID=UPI0029AF3AD4|nr:carboxymuconolactone decarboxylase family protein [Streptomyces sp. MI02-7b]MDX3072385.1 carboxymuconolactone decarboxylase family protein [Streptomyces sp. MI02-7b]
MPRLANPDPDTLPADVREFLSFLPPDPLVKMLSHAAGTVRPFIELAKAQFTSLELPARSRELVILTVAAYADCAFVAAQHEPMAQAAGIDEATRRLIADREPESPGLSPYDRAVVRLTAEVVRHPRVSDEIFGEARRFLSARELVEVLQVAGYYWSFSRVCTVLDVEITKVYGAGEPLLSDDAPGPGADAQ